LFASCARAPTIVIKIAAVSAIAPLEFLLRMAVLPVMFVLVTRDGRAVMEG